MCLEIETAVTLSGAGCIVIGRKHEEGFCNSSYGSMFMLMKT